MSGTGSSSFSGSNDVLADTIIDLCASYVADCVRPFTDKRDGKFDEDFDFMEGPLKVTIKGACCGTPSECCEWTAGGITLLTFLILLLLFLIGGCAYCCCGIGNPRGGCCNRGPVSEKLSANLL